MKRDNSKNCINVNLWPSNDHKEKSGAENNGFVFVCALNLVSRKNILQFTFARVFLLPQIEVQLKRNR